MKTRNITYDSSNYSGESNLSFFEAKDLFESIDWTENGNFYTLIFGDSFLQFIANNNEIIVEIMLNEDDLLVATKTVSKEEALKLIEYYFHHDEIGDLETFETTNL